MLGLPRRIKMHRPSSLRATEPSSGSAASTEQGDADAPHTPAEQSLSLSNHIQVVAANSVHC